MIHQIEKLASTNLGTTFHYKNYMKILDKCPSMTVPNFIMFEQHFTKKNQDYGCIIEGCEPVTVFWLFPKTVHFENSTASSILPQLHENVIQWYI